MGIPHHSRCALRLYGDDLDPDAVTAALGRAPTRGWRKGDRRVGPKSGRVVIERTGGWLLRAEDREPEDLPAQIREVLEQLSEDPAVWAELRTRCRIDMFCGVFMASGNDGLEFEPALMHALALRGIKLSLDLYDAEDADAAGDPPSSP
jgi:hypothetical protein